MLPIRLELDGIRSRKIGSNELFLFYPFLQVTYMTFYVLFAFAQIIIGVNKVTINVGFSYRNIIILITTQQADRTFHNL